jgi:HEAT repeat protein
MTIMAARADASQPLPNIVPTRQTRWIAAQMLNALKDENGYDAVLRLHHQVSDDQWAALAAILLNSGRLGGRPVMRATKYSVDERREAHRRYTKGDRSPHVVDGEREYQRLHKRSKRAA